VGWEKISATSSAPISRKNARGDDEKGDQDEVSGGRKMVRGHSEKSVAGKHWQSSMKRKRVKALATARLERCKIAEKGVVVH